MKNLLIVVLLTIAFPSIAKRTKTDKPNIIIFFADDMGYGDLGCFGSPNIRTPNIDKLANEGMKLTSFYVAGPVCTPSRAGLMAGRYPIHTLSRNIGPETIGGFPQEEPIIAEVLKEAGYRSMAIGKWHLGYSPKEYLPTGKGFDHYYGLPYSNDMLDPWIESDVPLKLYVDDKATKTVNYDQESLTIDYTNEAINFIEKSRSKPFFLYLPYSMPHLPISTTDNFRDRSAGGLYGDVIETIDWSVGEIVKTLERLNVDENTLIIFTSDNGPWYNLPDRMLQRGVKPWHQGSTGVLRGAKASTYEGGMRVPGIFNWKGVIPPGQVSSEMASTLDIFPTLIEAAKTSAPEGKEFDGYNILPFIKGEASSPRKEFRYYRGTKLEAIREGKWKFRYTSHMQESVDDDIKPQLFNMSDDPGEKYNVADIYPEIAKSMKETLDRDNALRLE